MTGYELYRRALKTMLAVFGVVLLLVVYFGSAVLLFHSGFDGHTVQLPAVALTGGVLVVYFYGFYPYVIARFAPDVFQQAVRELSRKKQL